MTAQPYAAVQTCTQCGGGLHPDEGRSFLVYLFCAATVYVDKTRVVFYWYAVPNLDEPQARSAMCDVYSGLQPVAATPIPKLMILSVEAARKDTLKEIQFNIQLQPPQSWNLP
jgi:hypothetical protein